ncbi:hypothetical protein QOT17_009464 [Balamuthia mandrillaris]
MPQEALLQITWLLPGATLLRRIEPNGNDLIKDGSNVQSRSEQKITSFITDAYLFSFLFFPQYTMHRSIAALALLSFLCLAVSLTAAHEHCELSLFNAFTSTVHDSLTFTVDGEEWAEVPFGERVVKSVPCSPFTVNVTELGKGKEFYFFSEGYLPRGWLVFKGYETTDPMNLYTGWSPAALDADEPPPYGGLVVELHGGDTPYYENYLYITNSTDTVVLDDSSQRTYRIGLWYSEEGSEFEFTLYTGLPQEDDSGSSKILLEETIQGPGEKKVAFVYVYGFTGAATGGGTGVEPALKVYVEELEWEEAGSDSATSRVTSPVFSLF